MIAGPSNQHGNKRGQKLINKLSQKIKRGTHKLGFKRSSRHCNCSTSAVDNQSSFEGGEKEKEARCKSLRAFTHRNKKPLKFGVYIVLVTMLTLILKLVLGPTNIISVLKNDP